MGDIGPKQQHYEVLPLRAPAEPTAPIRREPAVEAEAPREPAELGDRVSH